jgi:hypothetical protein
MICQKISKDRGSTSTNMFASSAATELDNVLVWRRTRHHMYTRVP